MADTEEQVVRWPQPHDGRYESGLEDSAFYPETSCHLFEAWLFPNTSGPLFLIDKLNGKELVEKLPHMRHSMEGEIASGGLRLIIADPIDNLLLSDNTPIPFSRPSYEAIISEWELPRITPTAVGGSNHFSSFVTRDEEGNITHLSYFCKSWRNLSEYQVVASYDVVRNQCNCLLTGTASSDETNEIITTIKEMGNLVVHPLLVPIAVLHSGTSSLDRKLSVILGHALELELSTGQHGWTFTSADSKEKLKPTFSADDFLELSKFVCQINSMTALFSRRTESHATVIEGLESAMARLDNITFPEAAQRSFQRSYLLTELLSYTKDINKHVILSLKECEQRTQVQANFLFNYRAHRDSNLNFQVAKDSKALAAASRRDSSSMKTIAILTMIFLPGTFISALFAMPLLKWDDDPSTPIITDNFWRYWAFTIPLTILVILAWVVWIVQKEARHAHEDAVMGISDRDVFSPVGGGSNNQQMSKREREEMELVNPGCPDEVKIRDTNAEIEAKRWGWFNKTSDRFHNLTDQVRSRKHHRFEMIEQKGDFAA